jgi:hypothetical protein
LPSEQEEVVTAKIAPVGLQEPPKCPLDCVSQAYTPEIDRSAARTARRQLRPSKACNRLTGRLAPAPPVAAKSAIAKSAIKDRHHNWNRRLLAFRFAFAMVSGESLMQYS